MKFNKYAWSLYKQSKQWADFSKVFDTDNVAQNEYAILRRFNPYEYGNGGPMEELSFYGMMEELWVNCISDFYDPYNNYHDNSEGESPKTLGDARLFWSDIIDHGVRDVHGVTVEQGDYQTMLAAVVMLSFLCYYVADEFFFPYMFRYRAFDLYKITDAFDITLPPLPRKSDYKARCMYYFDLCEVMYHFRKENDLSPLELCAFLYDYAPSYLDTLDKENPLPQPAQAWCIGGLIDDIDKDSSIKLWQASPETKRGDILIHYETTPISAITHIWISQTDGVIDPFFHYYANVYLSDGIEVPQVTLKDMRKDGYFSNHPIVRKNFQGVNGWRFTSEDYDNLLRMIRAKGGDTDGLPCLFTPSLPRNVIVKRERDVETELLEYYLNEMGLSERYERQIPIQSGRNTHIFPDYVIGYNGSTCKVMIEAKYHMKSIKEEYDAFGQARSYALILQADIMALCDKENIIIYKNDNGFDRSRGERYYWGDFHNPDTFQKIKSYFKHDKQYTTRLGAGGEDRENSERQVGKKD